MKLIVCLDEKNGMMFNHRRQSRDRLLVADLEKELGASPLYIRPYSLPLFEKSGVDYRVTDLPFPELMEGYCFVEDCDPAQFEDQIEEMILYRWNRHYPADLFFSVDLSRFRLTLSKDFAGSSHEKITKEIWHK